MKGQDASSRHSELIELVDTNVIESKKINNEPAWVRTAAHKYELLQFLAE